MTSNDYFFEHQRLRGYHLATEAIRSSSEATLLADELLPDAAANYLRECDNPRASAVAERVGLQFHVEMWAAVQRGKGAYHEDHVHEGVIVSGVYYAAVPEGSSPLVLKCPQNHNSDILIFPKEGDLVMFPPWLRHGVPPSTN